jgi:hypothetical protein
MTLVRYFKQYADQECGRVVFYSRFVLELTQGSLEHYDQPDGTNKFLSSVTLHVYGPDVPYPEHVANFLGDALSWGFAAFVAGPDKSEIHIRYMGLDPRNLMYRYPASISHEFGHAYHNWCGWYQDATWGEEFKKFFARQFCPSGTYPDGWSVYEAFANAWRCLKGSKVTRGVSGTANQGSDLTPPEIVDPAGAPWRKQFDILPETCAYTATFGIEPGTLEWRGDATGWWQFKNKQGRFVAHVSYNTWYQWVWSWRSWKYVWERFEPTYIRT